MFLSTGTLSICLQTAYLKSNATWTDGWVMGDGMNYDTMNPSRFRNIPRIIISCLWCAWQGKPKQGCVVPHTLTYFKKIKKEENWSCCQHIQTLHRFSFLCSPLHKWQQSSRSFAGQFRTHIVGTLTRFISTRQQYCTEWHETLVSVTNGTIDTCT